MAFPLGNVFSKSSGSSDTDYRAKNPSGITCEFINKLLEEYETPRELYGAIRLRGSMKSIVGKLVLEYPAAADIRTAGERIRVQSVDEKYTLDNPQTFEVYQLQRKLISQIYEDARKSLSPRSALLRYRQIFDAVFTGANSCENLGLDGIIDSKKE